MIKQIMTGNKDPFNIGSVKIERNLITNLDFNFKNPNIAEVFAGAQSKFINKNKEVNYEFELIKISKSDFHSKKGNQNYFIISDELKEELPHKFSDYKMSIKLNTCDFIRIKWAKKQTLLHEINPRKRYLEYLIISLPFLFIGFLLRGCYEENNKETTRIEKHIQQKTLGNNVGNNLN